MDKIHETRKQCEQAQHQGFIQDCKNEFEPKPLHEENASQARSLELLSYLPSALSAITLIFLVFTLLSSYSTGTKVVLGALLCVVVIGAEYGKRTISYQAAKRYALFRTISPGLALLLFILVGASMAGSYQGGNYLVTENATLPVLDPSAELDSLQSLLAAEAATIAALQATTWRGKITRDASKGIIEAKRAQNTLLAKVDRIEQARADELAGLQAEAGAKVVGLGYVLGGLAAFADLLLIGLLFRVVWLRYEVAELALSGAGNGSNVSSLAANGSSFNGSSLGTGAELATGAKNDRLPIGFQLPNVSSSNGKSYNDESLEEPLGNVGRIVSVTVDGKTTDLTEAEAAEAVKQLRQQGDHKAEAVATEIEKHIYVGERTRPCNHCGERYVFKSAKSKYCGDACRIAAWEKRNGKTFKKSKA